MLTPLCDAISSRAGLRFHMPGHKGRAEFPFLNAACDVTELPDTDDLYAPSGCIAEAQTLAARAMCAGSTIFLTGGATAGIHAMLMYALKPGDRLITSRNVHNSVISGCILGGIEPIWAEDCASAMDEYPDAKAVLITRPDYYGRCIDISRIAGRRMTVLVDQAHGAHFPFMDHPQDALKLGADIAVLSAHKTLPALTGGAYLNMAAPHVDADRMRGILRLCQTSSPSYLVMASLDWARAYMEDIGKEKLRFLCAYLGDAGDNDPTRLVFDVSGAGLTGYDAAQRLLEQNITVEMADERRVVAICTVMDEIADIDRLRLAVNALPRGTHEFRKAAPLPTPEKAMSLREAALSDGEWVSPKNAIGRIAAQTVCLYPPGVPLIFPGEVINFMINQEKICVVKR